MPTLYQAESVLDFQATENASAPESEGTQNDGEIDTQSSTGSSANNHEISSHCLRDHIRVASASGRKIQYDDLEDSRSNVIVDQASETPVQARSQPYNHDKSSRESTIEESPPEIISPLQTNIKDKCKEKAREEHTSFAAYQQRIKSHKTSDIVADRNSPPSSKTAS